MLLIGQLYVGQVEMIVLILRNETCNRTGVIVISTLHYSIASVCHSQFYIYTDYNASDIAYGIYNFGCYPRFQLDLGK